MIFVQLTESSARFITGLIIFLVVFAVIGWLSQLTGINPFIIIGVFVTAFVAVIAKLVSGVGAAKHRKKARSVRCAFVREDGKRCILDIENSAKYCKYHIGAAEISRSVPDISSLEKERQCQFIANDGAKCQKPKLDDAQYCIYHA